MNRFVITLIGLTSLMVAAPAMASDKSRSAIGAEDGFAEVALQFSIDGEEVFDSTAIVEPGRTGRLTLEKEGEDLAWQLRYTVDAPRQLPSGKLAADLSIEVFERRDGQWVSRSNPRLGVFLGKAASVGGPVAGKHGVEGSYEIGVMVNSLSAAEVEARTGGRLETLDCPASDLGHPDLQKAGGGDNSDNGGCCSSPCAAGSLWYGYYLYCCGVVWCCDCGTCCSP